MKVYLDNCCFNRPFDDQSSIKVRLETEAKLYIQQQILDGYYQLVWSYILDYENAANPFVERKTSIAQWRKHAQVKIAPSEKILKIAQQKQLLGVKPKDALHLACAQASEAQVFFTTDKGLLNKASQVSEFTITNPLGWLSQLGD